MKNPLLDRPWLLIVAGYLFGMSAWIAMVFLAIEHQPADVPIHPAPTESATR